MSKKLFILLLIILVITAGYFVYGAFATSNPHTWTNGLVGYWSFDGPMTTSTAGTRDVSNTGNWGAFSGGVKPVPGISGQALFFDGVDDYVNSGITDYSDITVEAWINPNTVSSRGGIFGFNYFRTTLSQLNNSIRWNITNSAGSARTISYAGITSGSWYHAVGTYNSSTNSMKLYVNGILQASDTVVGTKDSDQPFYGIGRHTESVSGWQNFYFNGLIDEVRVYNRALSADEVKQHYDQTKRNLVINNPSGTPPVGWWKMDEATGATVRDYSANANNGTVTNGGYGATSTDGKIGKSLSFDGVDDYVFVPYNSILDPLTALSLELWFKQTVPVAAWKSIAGKNTTWGTGYSIWAMENERLYLRVDTLAGAKTYVFPYQLDTWYHIVMVFSGTSLQIFANGVAQPIDTFAETSLLPADTTPFVIGARADYTSGGQFPGLVDDVRIYNYARTADQITADYQAGAYRTTINASNPNQWTNGLVGYWNFDGQNTTSTNGTRDTSGNNYWGTFSGGVKPVAGISGQALLLDGVDDMVSGSVADNSINLDGSLEAWVKMPSFGASDQPFVAIRSGDNWFGMASWYNIFTGEIYGSADGLSCSGATPSCTARSGQTCLLTNYVNTWTHLVTTYSNTLKEIDYYVNGVNVGYQTWYMCSLGATQTFQIGGKLLVWANGTIDEVRIYNRVLSADEILQHYQQTRRNIDI